MKTLFRRLFATLLLGAAALAQTAFAQTAFEPHHRLAVAGSAQHPVAAITLDACGGAFDVQLINLLVAKQVSATIFVTKKWLDHNRAGTAALLAHPALFDLQDHGTAHIPAVIGHRVYGIAGEPDMAHVRSEVTGAAQAITQLTGHAPQYYRGATAVYDPAAMRAIEAMGYAIAGFSVNADAGATLPQPAIVARLRSVKNGDVIIAHMNKPAGATFEGFAVALPELLARGFRFVRLSDAQLVPV
ncbi:MAG: polysaccharide deacetylase family protein [Burkholderiaceae bacterium]